MRKVLGLLTVSLSLLTPCLAQEMKADSLPLSLEDAWQRADDYSLELRSKRLDQQINNEHIQDAQQQRLPRVEASASYGKLANIPVFVDGILNEPEYIPIEDHSTYDVGMEAYFNLYNGHKTKLAIEKARSQADLSEHIAQATQSEIHYEVAQYYLDILRSKEFGEIIEHNIARNEQRLSQITQLYQNGVVLKSDLLRAQLQLSQQKINRQKMLNNVGIASQKLNQILGFEDNHPLRLADSISFTTLDSERQYADYVALAMEQSPFEKMAETQISLSELNEQEVKAEKRPRIGLFGEYSYSYPQIMLYPYSNSPYLLGVAGIKISYDLSSLYTHKHKHAAASLQVQQQQVAKANTEESLRSKIKTAYLHFREDQDNIDVSKINIQQAEENYRIVHQTYFNKLSLLTDLLEADTELLRAQFDLVNNYISARLHFYQLQKITGQL
ncbi:TolC family protein [Mangrovibacterium lignilyticum]|uniref:TolC family protein n=1 Tax=Mangrovibacterium lignilyticum TaxID=2668052 RepID=UPI0013D08D00|nr:TolC family protein [Mangrovibacterium lignilyticum]